MYDASAIARVEARLRAGDLARPAFPVEAKRRAAVAVCLRARGGETEVLLIRRAERVGDPWSGHAAFPGGRAEPGDPSIEATALREAKEEVGLDLAPPRARILGRMPDQPGRAQGRWIGLAITPVVFEVQGDPPFTLDPREVDSTLWVPLSALGGGRHEGRMIYWWRPLRRVPVPLPFLLPCWRIGGLTIWGLTHRMLGALLTIARPEGVRGAAGARRA